MTNIQPINSKTNNSDTSILPNGFLVLEESGQMFQVENGNLTPYVADKKIIKEKKIVAKDELLDTGMEEPMLQPPPLAVLKRTASFYFHPDDEEEVGLVNRGLSQENVRQFSIQKIVNKAINTFGLNLTEQDNKKLSQLFFAALRDRRSLPETEALLVDGSSALGMGLPATLAGGLMVFISQIKSKISSEGGLVVDETQIKSELVKDNSSVKFEPGDAVVNAKTVNIVSQTTNNKAVDPLENIDPSVFSRPKKKSSVIEEIVNEIKHGNNVGVQSAPPVEVEKELKKVIKEEVEVVNDEFNVSLNLRTSVNQKIADEATLEKKIIEEKPVAQNLSRFVTQSKAVVNDIKIDNKSLGPIDELALMNLATFRRLSPNSEVAGQRVSAIINALGKQSLARKTAGIRAWRSSPLYKQYLLIGQMSMESGKTVPAVIDELKSKGEMGLTIVEFETIGDINRLTRM